MPVSSLLRAIQYWCTLMKCVIIEHNVDRLTLLHSSVIPTLSVRTMEIFGVDVGLVIDIINQLYFYTLHSSVFYHSFYSLLHSVNLIVFTPLLAHLILRISSHHSPHLHSNHVSLPRPFTPDLKLISFTNPFLHSHSFLPDCLHGS